MIGIMEETIVPKEVAVYIGAAHLVAELGELTMLDVYFVPNPEERPVCKGCPRRRLRACAFRHEDFRIVDPSTKADKGSEERDLKTLNREPACFHPDRAIEIDQG